MPYIVVHVEPWKIYKQKNILFYKDQFGGNTEDGWEDERLESEKLGGCCINTGDMLKGWTSGDRKKGINWKDM